MPRYKAIVEFDDDPMPPWEWDQLGEFKVSRWLSRHCKLGSKETIDGGYTAEDDEIVLPFYAYVHGGVAISAASFDCRWDSGFGGVIVATKERAEKLGVAWDKKTIAGQLEAEINEANKYLTGMVWRYQVIDTLNDDIVDSCSSFYEESQADCEAAASADYHNKRHEAATEHAEMGWM